MEMTLNLRDLLYRILLKWRIIVISALICCVLFTVIGTINSAVDHFQARTKLEQQTVAGGSHEGELPVVVPDFRPVDISYTILGGFVGVVGMAGIFALGYMFTPSLRTADDIENTFHLSVLSVVATEKHYNAKFQKVDRLIRKLFSPKESEDAVQLACAQIRLAIQHYNISSLLLTGSCDTVEQERVRQQIFDQLRADIAYVYCEASLCSRSAAVESLSNANGVVLVERVGVSTYRNIHRSVVMCQRYQIPVIGCVVIL